VNRAAVEAAAKVICEAMPKHHLNGRRKRPCPGCVLLTEQALLAYTDVVSETVDA
jgi:hypothetical protein